MLKRYCTFNIGTLKNHEQNAIKNSKIRKYPELRTSSNLFKLCIFKDFSAALAPSNSSLAE
jgi:hypothetical protein